VLRCCLNVPGFLGDRVVKDDVVVLRPARFTVFLEFLKTFVVELLFVPVVLGEELIVACVPSRVLVSAG